jgi:hypothetical protein
MGSQCLSMTSEVSRASFVTRNVLWQCITQRVRYCVYGRQAYGL